MVPTRSHDKSAFLIVAFLLSLLSHFLCTQYYVHCNPVFFSPLLIHSFYRYEREHVTILAFFLGIFSDLGSSYFFGIHAFLYVVISCLLYKTCFLLKERWLTLTMLNMLFASLFLSLSYPLLILFQCHLTWNSSFFILNIKHFLLVNGVYGFVLCVLFRCLTPIAIKCKAILTRSRAC